MLASPVSNEDRSIQVLPATPALKKAVKVIVTREMAAALLAAHEVDFSDHDQVSMALQSAGFGARSIVSQGEIAARLARAFSVPCTGAC